MSRAGRGGAEERGVMDLGVIAVGLLVALAAAVVALPARRGRPAGTGAHHAGAMAAPGPGGGPPARSREDLDAGLLYHNIP